MAKSSLGSTRIPYRYRFMPYFLKESNYMLYALTSDLSILTGDTWQMEKLLLAVRNVKFHGATLKQNIYL